MHIKQRVRKIREFYKMDRTAFSADCGIKKKTIENIENGIQKINGEHIEILVKKYPFFAYWITTGLTLPESGQISPEIEEMRKKLNLKKAG